MLQITLSIDWEGEHLENVKDFIQVRKQIGEHIPFTHFICPSYFTSNIKGAAKKIKSAIYKQDEVALHVHCYKSLMDYCKVPFRTENDYYKTPLKQGIFSKLVSKYTSQTGRGVPLSVYDDEEIKSILIKSRKLLQNELNLDSVLGFRAGGWIANDNVLKTLQQLEFKYDSSAVPPGVLSKGYSENSPGNFNDDYNDTYGIFNQFIMDLWGFKNNGEGFLSNQIRHQYSKSIEFTTQPWEILPNLTEIPNNFGMTDFVDPEKTIIPFINKTENCIINYGCHLEGDIFYKRKLIDMIKHVQSYNTKYLVCRNFIN